MADPRAYMRVYVQLKARIEGGELAGGARLNIGLVADEFDVSRDTVQHALQLLEADGLVERFAGLGWYVREGELRRGPVGNPAALAAPFRLVA